MTIIIDETVYKKPKEKIKLDLILSYFRQAIKKDIIEFKKFKRTKIPGKRNYVWFSDISGKVIESKKLVQCDIFTLIHLGILHIIL